MFLPVELQYKIMSFIPETNLRLVCKDWNGEITNLQKEYLNIIGAWYKKRKVHEYFTKLPEMVRYYVVHYPEEFFIRIPEFAVSKLSLNTELLTVLPNQSDRKSSDVRNWMLNVPLDLGDWMIVGW